MTPTSGTITTTTTGNTTTIDYIQQALDATNAINDHMVVMPTILPPIVSNNQKCGSQTNWCTFKSCTSFSFYYPYHHVMSSLLYNLKNALQAILQDLYEQLITMYPLLSEYVVIPPLIEWMLGIGLVVDYGNYITLILYYFPLPALGCCALLLSFFFLSFYL